MQSIISMLDVIAGLPNVPFATRMRASFLAGKLAGRPTSLGSIFEGFR